MSEIEAKPKIDVVKPRRRRRQKKSPTVLRVDQLVAKSRMVERRTIQSVSVKNLRIQATGNSEEDLRAIDWSVLGTQFKITTTVGGEKQSLDPTSNPNSARENETPENDEGATSGTTSQSS